MKQKFKQPTVTLLDLLEEDFGFSPQISKNVSFSIEHSDCFLKIIPEQDFDKLQISELEQSSITPRFSGSTEILEDWDFESLNLSTEEGARLIYPRRTILNLPFKCTTEVDYPTSSDNFDSSLFFSDEYFTRSCERSVCGCSLF